jgi:hypothetical protein
LLASCPIGQNRRCKPIPLALFIRLRKREKKWLETLSRVQMQIPWFMWIVLHGTRKLQVNYLEHQGRRYFLFSFYICTYNQLKLWKTVVIHIKFVNKKI